MVYILGRWMGAVGLMRCVVDVNGAERAISEPERASEPVLQSNSTNFEGVLGSSLFYITVNIIILL